MGGDCAVAEVEGKIEWRDDDRRAAGQLPDFRRMRATGDGPLGEVHFRIRDGEIDLRDDGGDFPEGFGEWLAGFERDGSSQFILRTGQRSLGRAKMGYSLRERGASPRMRRGMRRREDGLHFGGVNLR